MNTNRNYTALLLLLFVITGMAIIIWTASSARADATTAAYGAAPVVTGTPVCGPSWGVVPSPNITGTNSVLNAAAMVSADEVWAVGFYTNTDGVAQTLVERWDGSQWSIVPSPSIGAVGNNYLTGVSAVASDNVWAVGYYQIGAALQTLILRWDGTQWSHVPSPNPGATENYLYAVASVSAGDAWAVGYYNNGTLLRTLTLRWNGTSWNTVSSPNPTFSVGAGLRGVTVVSANEVWAVGAYSGLTLTLQTLVLRWNGTNWSIVSSPNSGSGNNALIAASAASAGNVWAVGLYNDGSRYLPLTERWNGASWSVVPSPSFGTADNGLSGVAAVSATEVWAVGAYGAGLGVRGWGLGREAAAPNPSLLSRTSPQPLTPSFETLAVRWNGAQWSRVPSENPGSTDNGLFGVAASAGGAWAVGSYSDGGPTLTLVERYSDTPCQTPTQTTTPLTNTPTQTTTAVANTPTATATTPASATSTPQPTLTLTLTPGGSPTSTATATTNATSTTTPCAITFTDVQPDDYFYEAVRYLYCAGAISGYGDNTFRPYNNTTRGQLCKIVTLAEQWPINTNGGPHFTDVPEGSVFYDFVETAFNREIISGYGDNTFRPGNNVTRGQLCKIVVLAEEWAINTTGGPHFSDVPNASTFYPFIETAFNRQIVSGYGCGPSCLEFRPGNSATRGQICVIIHRAITQP